MKELEAENIPVVDEGLVTSWQPGGSPPSISDSLISDWGKEVGGWSCKGVGGAGIPCIMQLSGEGCTCCCVCCCYFAEVQRQVRAATQEETYITARYSWPLAKCGNI